MTRIVVATMLVAVSGSYSLAQNSIHWKASQKASHDAAPDPPAESEAKSRDPMRMHRVVRYPAPPGDTERARLELSGARILQYVPDNGLLVSTPKDWTSPEGTIQAAGLVASSTIPQGRQLFWLKQVPCDYLILWLSFFPMSPLAMPAPSRTRSNSALPATRTCWPITC